MSQPWEDRRALFQRGKEVHEPAPPRRLSQSVSNAATGVADAVRKVSIGAPIEKTTSASSIGSSPTSQRRRSSAASGLFGNLQQHKRGSEDYHERRADHHDQSAATGIIGGWFNSTFRGVKPPASAGAEDKKRGVME